MTGDGDVFGRALLDWARGGGEVEVLERDDGFTQFGAGPDVYLSAARGWPLAERRALRDLRGRVLDVGCGAGRVALELQRRDVHVVGLDASARAVAAARLRGVQRVWHGRVEDLGSRSASFDAIVMFGNNFGIFGTPDRARRALARLARGTVPGARLFIESTSPYFGGAPGLTRSYYRRNLERGRPPGELRLRYHYGPHVGPWFDWLYVSRSDLRSLVRGTGWRVDAELEFGVGEPYVSILAKG